MLFKKFFLPSLALLLLSLFVSSVLLIALFFNSDVNWPLWARVFMPFLISFILVALFNKWVGQGIDFGRDLWGQIPKKKVILFLLLPLFTAILFQPVWKSLRYNFGSVLQLSNMKDLKENVNPSFLEVDNWYVDRMRVIPFNYVDEGLNVPLGKVRVNVLFLVPIFQYEDAYRSFARAWLAFDYTKVIDKEDFNENYGQDFVKSSMIHFKRMDLRQFQYFESFPRDDKYRVFTDMQQLHGFYKSGFGNIYLGQDIDRDELSAYYAKYALFLFAIVGIPGLLLLSLALYLTKKYWNRQEAAYEVES